MLSTKRNHRLGRGLLAVCLAFLFSFASLAPLAASSFNDPGTSCCRSKTKCCCGKHSHSADGPTISAASCTECDSAILGSVSPIGPAVTQLPAVSTAIRPAGVVALTIAPAQSRLCSHDLQQRPPPPSALA